MVQFREKYGHSNVTVNRNYYVESYMFFKECSYYVTFLLNLIEY